MIIYEYRCTKCNRRFEVLKDSNKASEEEECVFCGSKSVRVYGCSGLKFVGSGFYETDYKQKNDDRSDV